MFRNIQTGHSLSSDMNADFAKFRDLVERRLPEKVEVELEKQIVESFDQESFKDGKSSKWQRRKKEDAGRKILIGKGSGKMKRSIEVSHNKDEVKASSDVIYTAVHNEGLKAGRGAGFIMPQRKFMPIPGEADPYLEEKVQKYLDSEMDKIFK